MVEFMIWVFSSIIIIGLCFLYVVYTPKGHRFFGLF